MKTNILLVIRWAAYILIGLWGMATFILLAGEDNPDLPMSIGAFILIKVVAIFSGIACYRTAKYLYEKGLLPGWLDKDDEEELI